MSIGSVLIRLNTLFIGRAIPILGFVEVFSLLNLPLIFKLIEPERMLVTFELHPDLISKLGPESRRWLMRRGSNSVSDTPANRP